MLRLGSAYTWIVLVVSAGVFTTGTVLTAEQEPAQERVSFSRDVLPILSENCFLCHGPDGGTRQVGLRLDIPEGAFADRDGRFAIVPGKPEESLVVQRITHPDTPMPPPDSGKKLTQDEIETITRWIAEGAKYDRHWSFEPLPKSVAVPNVQSDWPRDDIDRFILARLQSEGLSPSPEADRLRWLRRVTLDLTGLPPTEEEIEEFPEDGDYEETADRLLASPHYGERIATEWLDAARYADSYGYQSDLLMPTWPYRDWVVRAFNDNLPYDEFLTWQLAGDLLDEPTQDQRLATAFNRLHRQSNEGGSIALEFKTKYASDRVETFGTAMLGLTVGCARCHDHKFDPITQKEYYQMFAYFNSIDEYGLLLSSEIVPTPSMLLPTDEQATQLSQLRLEAEKARGSYAKARSDAEDRFQSWLASDLSDRTDPTEPNIAGLIARFSFDEISEGKFANRIQGKPFAERLLVVELASGRSGQSGQSVVFDGDNGIAVRGLPGRERWDEFTWSFWVSDPGNEQQVVLMHRTGGTDVGFCGFDLMLEGGYLTARVMRHWPGNGIAVKSLAKIEPGVWTHVAWSFDGSGQADGLKIYVDSEQVQTKILNDRIWKEINAYGDLGPSRGDWAFGQRFRDLGFKGGKIDDVAFADRALSALEIADLFDGKALAEALGAPAANVEELRGLYLSAIDPQVRAAKATVRKAQEDLANHEAAIYEISVMEESRVQIPAHLLARGAYDAPRTDDNRVERDVPATLPALEPGAQGDRLGLARWLTDSDHPLTARVAVNRIWQMLFGIGLVETSENFGLKGTRPTHPALLDYLARDFVDNGWDVKALLKKVVLSATYRQDSALTAELASRDPLNLLYARGPSYRLSAEMVRDTALAAAGLLDKTIGGAPVNPYQPAGIWRENNTMTPAFRQSVGKALYRRSLYTVWKRTAPAPNMLIFDATSREVCTVRRATTNTPLQALVLLNDPQFVEAARVLAELVLKQENTDKERIDAAFLRLAGRRPDEREADVLLATLREQRRVFRASISGSIALVDVGDTEPAIDLRATEVAAMTVTVQTIMNSDAVIWRR
ncbi:MAG: DUF1553 domain-containing protein [Armatimonadetes bacterium]|nr:DUF1553 domain-containing protein [Armatimonadota bacterium]